MHCLYPAPALALIAAYAAPSIFALSLPRHTSSVLALSPHTLTLTLKNPHPQKFSHLDQRPLPHPAPPATSSAPCHIQRPLPLCRTSCPHLTPQRPINHGPRSVGGGGEGEGGSGARGGGEGPGEGVRGGAGRPTMLQPCYSHATAMRIARDY